MYDWWKRFQYEEEEKISEIRQILLVVFTLIAAVTFQSGVNPPGGVWQDSDKGHSPGRAIRASNPNAFLFFLLFNTFSFSCSIMVILAVTNKFPFQMEIRLAILSMTVTYIAAIFAVTPDDESIKFRYVLLALFAPVVIRFGFEFCSRHCDD
ncbi:PGG domain [Sesbania bispinosa]|nr:PGG domain [Sesbania bispinosa]